MRLALSALLAGSLIGAAATGALAQADRFDAIADLPFEQNRPTEDTRQALMEELTFQRATQTYVWALALLNTMGMRDGAAEAFGTGYNVMPIWTQRLDVAMKQEAQLW